METRYFCLPGDWDQLRFVLSQINELSPEITCLNLQQNDFSQYSMNVNNVIFSAIPAHVRHLNLSHCRLEHLSHLDDFLACLPPHLDSLDLSWNGLSYLTAKAVSKLPVQLTQLNLSLNEFNACFEFHLFDSLLKMLSALPKNLRSFDFSGNNLSDFGCWQSIFQILAAMPGSLQSLDLSSNGLSYFRNEMRDIFSALPKSLHTLVLAGNGFSSKIFLSADAKEFTQAIRNNDMELQMLLKAIPSHVKHLKLQSITLAMESIRLELDFWENFRALKTICEKSSLAIKHNLWQIMQQFQKLYDANENLESINLLLKDCLGVVLGKIRQEEFRQKAKTLQGHVSPMWNVLGALMLALTAILFCQGFYICGSFTLLSAIGFYYKGQNFGLCKSAEQINQCLVDNSRLIS